MDGLPETVFLQCLEGKRKYGPKDYSVQSYFIAYLAKIVLQLKTDQQLICHLKMNSQHRQICGFETNCVRLKNGAIKLVHAPFCSAYSRFIRELEEVCPNIEEVDLALDGKFIDSYAAPYGKEG